MDRIPPQPTVMVTGSVGRQLRWVAHELFDERTAAHDGAVVVTTRESPTALDRRLSADPRGLDRECLAVVDARGASDADADADVGWLQRVDPAADPVRVDGVVSTGLDWLSSMDVERRHFLYDTLSTDDRLPDPDAAYDRAYQLAMTVGAEEGLALFTLDTDGLSAAVVEKLGHLFDVHVELRATRGEPELKWTGLLGASDDWVRLAEADLGVGGFR